MIAICFQRGSGIQVQCRLLPQQVQPFSLPVFHHLNDLLLEQLYQHGQPADRVSLSLSMVFVEFEMSKLEKFAHFPGTNQNMND